MNPALIDAIGKRLRAEKLSQRDQRLLSAHDKAETQRLCMKYLAGVPAGEFRRLAGLTRAQCDRLALDGVPVVGARVDLLTVLPGMFTRLLDAVDVESADGDSPALERLRAARADMAELERDRMVGTLLPRAETHEALAGVAAIIRLSGERLEREFGPDARAILDEALDEADAGLDAAFGVDNNGGPGPAKG